MVRSSVSGLFLDNQSQVPTLDVESLIGHEAFTPYLRIDSLPTTKVIDPTKH